MDKRLCRHDERPALRVSALLKATTSRCDVGFLHIRPRES